MDKVVLAYSGGLDTSVLVRILREEYKLAVVCVHVDVGEARAKDLLAQKAERAGAVAFEFVEAQEEFVKTVCFRALQANALYEGVYPLSASLSRALIAKHLVAAAKKHGATHVAHGSTGKGNDQVRFDLSTRALAPELKILAPQRERNISRDEAMEYAKKWNIEVPTTAKKPWSIDENLWGRSIEGGELEDPNVEPPEDCFAWTKGPQAADKEPRYVRIGFEQGLPVSLDGEKLSPAKLVAKLNGITGNAGVGRIDLMENRVIGIKSRENYECPAAVALIFARKDLERFTTVAQVTHLKAELDRTYAQMVYEGFWYSPLREALDAFNDSVARTVTGEVTLKLHMGGMRVVGRKSDFGVYNKGHATYGVGDTFDHRAAEGFIQLLGLQLVEFRRLHPVKE
jgi:argininosuccinate synthase